MRGRHYHASLAVEIATPKGAALPPGRMSGERRERGFMMIMRIVSAPAGPVRSALVASLTALAMFAVSAMDASAHAPAPTGGAAAPKAKKAAPKAPAAP